LKRAVVTALTLLVVALLLTSPFVAYVPVVSAQKPEGTTYEPIGPRVDELLIKIYYTPEAEWAALEAGEIDITDWPLPVEKVDEYSRPEWQDKIWLYEYSEYGYFLFDLNHRLPDGTPNWPISNVHFRRALAHLVDKEKIVREIVKGYGIPIDSVILPIHGVYYNPDVPTYEYSRDLARQELELAGLTWDENLGKWIDPHTGEPLRPIIIYARADDPYRLAAAEMLRDEMIAIGLDVDWRPRERMVCYEEVMVKYEYDIYTGGWIYMLWPDYLYDLYSSDADVRPEPWALNYPGFHNDTFDEYAKKVKFSLDLDEVIEACHECQRIFAEQVACIPLWTTVGVKAMRSGWDGVVNEVGIGINSWWTFFNIRPAGKTSGGVIKYGFKSDIETLNPIKAEWYWDWEVLNKIYDTLIMIDPFTRELKPWMCYSWEMEPWTPPGGGEGTKTTIHLLENITWHNGRPFTAADVEWTFKYLMEQQPPYWQPYLVGLVDVKAVDDYTVEFYHNITSYWILTWIGAITILPREVWEPVGANWREFEPTTPEDLIGTGPFIFVERRPGEYVRLKANPHYFRLPPASISVEAPEALTKGKSATVRTTITRFGAGLEGLTVTLRILKDSEVVRELTMSDVGGGVYETEYPTDLDVGKYTVEIVSDVATWSGTLTIRAPGPGAAVYVGGGIVVIIIIAAIAYYVRKRR